MKRYTLTAAENGGFILVEHEGDKEFAFSTARELAAHLNGTPNTLGECAPAVDTSWQEQHLRSEALREAGGNINKALRNLAFIKGEPVPVGPDAVYVVLQEGNDFGTALPNEQQAAIACERGANQSGKRHHLFVGELTRLGHCDPAPKPATPPVDGPIPPAANQDAVGTDTPPATPSPPEAPPLEPQGGVDEADLHRFDDEGGDQPTPPAPPLDL